MPHYCQNTFQAVALLTTHFPLPPCPQNAFPRLSPLKPQCHVPHYCQNAFQAVALPHIPMSSKCISCAINPSNPNVRCPTIVKMHFRLLHYLTPHFSLPQSPQNAFRELSTPQTPMLGVPMLSNCISGAESTSHPIFHCPHVLKMNFVSYTALPTPFSAAPSFPRVHQQGCI